jgi:hypothetical protein
MTLAKKRTFKTLDTNTITNIFTAVWTVSSAVVALFKDDISKWRNKPKL